MKIRTDYVSNSSSSSFVLAVDENVDTKKINVDIKVNISKFVSNKIKTIDELHAYFVRDREYDIKKREHLGDFYKRNPQYQEPDTELEKKFDYFESIIKSGKTILLGEVGDEDGDPVSALIYDNGFNNIELPDEIKDITEEVDGL